MSLVFTIPTIMMQPLVAIPQTAVIGRQKPITPELFTLARVLAQ